MLHDHASRQRAFLAASTGSTSRFAVPSGVWALLLGLALPLVGCGGGGGIGAVNTMPRRASEKAMDKAEECDDGDLKSCTWIGIWFMVGGAGPERRYEGRRFLDYACREGHSPACNLRAALDKAGNKTAAKPAPAPTPAPSSSGGLGLAGGSSVDDGGGSAPSAPVAPAAVAPSADAGDCERGLPSSAADDVREAARRCDNGNLSSCQQVGVWYLKGQGGKDRVKDGVLWLKHSCDRGHEPACALIEELKRRLQEMKDQGKI